MDICPINNKPCDSPKLHQVSETKNGVCKTYYLCDKCATKFFDQDDSPKKKKIKKPLDEDSKDTISKLQLRLEEAIKKENYLEAGSLKNALDQVKSTTDRKKSLEILLNQAVINGDFDMAKKIKSDIDNIKF